MGLVGGGMSYRRDAALTVKRGEWVLEEVEVRREAWYAREEAWKAADGDGGADMVGEDDEVSMSRQHRVGWWRRCLGGSLRLRRETPATIFHSYHSRRYGRGEEGTREERRGRGSVGVAWKRKPPARRHPLLAARGLAVGERARWRCRASHWAAAFSRATHFHLPQPQWAMTQGLALLVARVRQFWPRRHRPLPTQRA
jgi:hypothetical protein